jgi:hypothetical protein
MAWHIPIWYWLVHAALGSLVVLAGGCVTARLCQQPVRRLRAIELTLFGCLVVPWVHLLPVLPQWSLGWLRPSPISTDSPGPIAAEMVVGGNDEEALRRDIRTVRAEEPLDPPAATPAVWPVVRPEPALATGLSLDASSIMGLSLPPILVIAYLGLVGGVLGWWLLGLLKLRWLYHSTYPAPLHAVGLFRKIAGPAGDGVALLVSDRLDMPLTFTWRRPIIVLPGSLCRGGETSALRFCLAHEWSHVERRDIWMWQMATVAQVLFFYQPLFWWLRRQLRLCQDYLADALAVQQATAAEDYAEYLVALARRRLGHSVPAALGIGDRRSNLYRRISMLINPPHRLDHRCRWLWTAACAAGIAGLLAVVAAVRLDAAPNPHGDKEAAQEDAPKKSPQAQPIPYSGKVVDKDTGKGISAATVTVRRTTYGDPKGEKVLQETKHATDAEGTYRFVIPPEQAAEHFLYIELDVEAPGYAPRSHFGYSFAMIQKNEKMGGRPFFENVDLRPGKEITGMIETPDGKPAAGVKVLAYSNTSKTGEEFEYGSFANAKTDEQGRFRLCLITPGPAVFWILPEKYAPTTHVLKDPSKRGDVGRFILSAGIVLKGKVLDTNGKPVRGVYVHADKRGGIEDFNLPVADHIRRTALSDDQGEFEFGPLPAGKYELRPEEHGYDASKDEARPPKRPLPDLVFLRQHATLKDGQPPEPIEVRAVPHVVIEAQYEDSKGKPTRGHAGHLFGRMDKSDSWFGECKVDAHGKMTIRAPHGLTDARLQLSTNEHGVLRHRFKKDDPLSASREIKLGTLNDDVRGITIIRYVAPILVVNALDPSGAPLKKFQVKVEYAPGKSPKERNSSFINGVQGDVYFEKQEDGRWRSSQLLPDEEITVTVSAEDFEPYQENMKLAEGTTKELTAKLKKN